jgi:hypothetical protein
LYKRWQKWEFNCKFRIVSQRAVKMCSKCQDHRWLLFQPRRGGSQTWHENTRLNDLARFDAVAPPSPIPLISTRLNWIWLNTFETKGLLSAVIYSLAWVSMLYMKPPITVAARSKAWTVFARSNTGIVGSNPTRDTDVCVRLFCVCVVLCAGSGLATGWSPVQKVLATVLGLRNWKSGQGPQGL